MRNAILTAVFLSLALFFQSASARAQSYREAVKVPPVEVYKSMIVFAQKGEHQKVANSLNVLAPIVNHIRVKFKYDSRAAIQKAVRRKDSDKVLSAVQTLVAWDIKAHLSEAEARAAGAPAVARTSIKAARLNYELLSEAVYRVDPQANQNIKQAFREALAVFDGGPVKTGKKTAVDTPKMKAQFNAINSDLEKIFLK
jgi:hypothetical protein